MLKLTAVKIFRAVFCALQKVSFSAQNGQSFQACLFPLVLLINISFEVIFFYGFHRLLYTTEFSVTDIPQQKAHSFLRKRAPPQHIYTSITSASRARYFLALEALSCPTVCGLAHADFN